MENKFENQLNEAFFSNAPKTNELYKRWICKLIRYFDREIRPENMNQYHIDDWLAWMVRPMGYSRSTTNQAKRAIKIFFDYIDNPMKVKMVSTRNQLHTSNILTQRQIKSILDDLLPFYKIIVNDIYMNLRIEKSLNRFPSGRGVPKAQTVNQKLKLSASKNEIFILVTLQTIRQSGIVHQLSDSNDWREIMEKANLKESSIKKYQGLL